MGDPSSRRPAPGSIDWAANQFRRILAREEAEAKQRRRLRSSGWQPPATRDRPESDGPRFGDGRDELADMVQSDLDRQTQISSEARRQAEMQVAQASDGGIAQESPRRFRKLPRDDSEVQPWSREAHDLAFENTSRHEGYDGRVHNDGAGIPTIGHGYALLIEGLNGRWVVRDDADLAVMGKSPTPDDRQRLQRIADDLNQGTVYTGKHFEDAPNAGEFDLGIDKTEARWLFDLAAPQYWRAAVSGADEDNFQKLRPERQAVLFDFAYRAPGHLRGNAQLQQALSTDLVSSSWDSTVPALIATMPRGDRRARYNTEYWRNPLANNVYTVQARDTWKGIARRTGMEEKYLAQINGIVIPENGEVPVFVGQRLYIRSPQSRMHGRIR